MQIVSAREFRTNQSAVLRRARNGESIVLTSRLGAFKITPVTEEDNLTTRIAEALHQVRGMREGKIKGYSVNELLDEL